MTQAREDRYDRAARLITEAAAAIEGLAELIPRDAMVIDDIFLRAASRWRAIAATARSDSPRSQAAGS